MAVDSTTFAETYAKRFEAVSQETVKRWVGCSARREGRDRAVAADKPLEADSRIRLARRINNLVGDMKEASNRGAVLPEDPELRSLVTRADPVRPEELTNRLVKEAIIGATNFLSIEFLERGARAARSVGRVVLLGTGGVRGFASAFMVGESLALTNHHVVATEDEAAVCGIQMDYEARQWRAPKAPQVFAFRPDRFFISDADLDFALVAVEQTGSSGGELSKYGWLSLDPGLGKISVNRNDFLNIIQHPAGREKEVVLRDNRVRDLDTDDNAGGPKLGPFIHYEGDTEKGSSGSPVLSDQWQVFALHHAGVPKRNKDGTTKTNKNGDTEFEANEGVRVSSMVARLAARRGELAPEKRAILETFLAMTGDKGAPTPVDETDRVTSEKTPARRGPVTAETPITIAPRPGVAEVTIPVRISVAIGGAEASRPGPDGPSPVAGGDAPRPPRPPRGVTRTLQPEESPGFVEEALDISVFADREGYKANFLGVPLPMPKLKKKPKFGGALKIARPSPAGDTHLLRYLSYSIIMSAKRKLAYVSACNVDFGAAATADRDEGRSGFRNDPRIDGDQQLGNKFYKGTVFDRGHLTRRDDAAWGATKNAAIASNDDTFFYTNAGPQHWIFNQSDAFTGKAADLWGDLENHIADQGAAQRSRLSIFNGPVFHDSETNLIPISFYKIVAWKDEGESPGAVGFVLDQSAVINDPRESMTDFVERIEVGRFDIRQKRIKDIETMLDLDLGDVVDWDVLAGQESFAEAADRGVTIRSVRDIVLK